VRICRPGKGSNVLLLPISLSRTVKTARIRRGRVRANCCHLRRSNTVAINLVGDSIKNSDRRMLRHSTEQQRGERTYPPLNTLKSVAEDVWIVDGPVIRFGMSWPKMLFPTRMTIIRVASGNLFIHSPTPLISSLKREVDGIGTPRWIIGPNRIHYWWIPEWHAGFPVADVYLAPRIRDQAGNHIAFDTLTLDRDASYPWDGEISTLPISSTYMTEVEFFHRASRTLVLTDLIEAFEPQKLSLVMRWLTRLGGVQHPDGQMPRNLRLTFRKANRELRSAVETMIGWKPERVIFAHGHWYRANGTAELQRAFRWLLDG
jgi:Domain of unknown function (DUF4336)